MPRSKKNRVRRYHLHVPGLVYMGFVIVMALSAAATQNNLLYWAFAVLFTALVVSGVISGAMLMRTDVRRLDPHHGAVGEPLVVRYQVTNRSRLTPVFNVHLQELPVTGGRGFERLMPSADGWVMHVGPHENVHGEIVFWPTRRGRAEFNRVRLWTTFPFGIIRKSLTWKQSQHTLIYPQVFELKRGVLSALTPLGPMGSRVTPRSGGHDDYFGLREYKPGDSMRHIAWKRTAKLDELVCVERTQPSPPKIRVVLDLRTPTDQLQVAEPGPEARELEERAISLAASIMRAADLDNYEVGLTVLGLAAPRIAIRHSHWHLQKIMAALASLELDDERTGPGPEAIHEQERAGLIIISPDRVRTVAGRPDAWHLTARQLEQLSVRPIGWDAQTHREQGKSARRAHVHVENAVTESGAAA